jgi:hypothetical protein
LLLQTPEALLYALGLLVALVRFNARNTRDMQDLHGYAIVSYLLKRKAAVHDFR